MGRQAQLVVSFVFVAAVFRGTLSSVCEDRLFRSPVNFSSLVSKTQEINEAIQRNTSWTDVIHSEGIEVNVTISKDDTAHGIMCCRRCDGKQGNVQGVLKCKQKAKQSAKGKCTDGDIYIFPNLTSIEVVGFQGCDCNNLSKQWFSVKLSNVEGLKLKVDIHACLIYFNGGEKWEKPEAKVVIPVVVIAEVISVAVVLVIWRYCFRKSPWNILKSNGEALVSDNQSTDDIPSFSPILTNYDQQESVRTTTFGTPRQPLKPIEVSAPALPDIKHQEWSVESERRTNAYSTEQPIAIKHSSLRRSPSKTIQKPNEEITQSQRVSNLSFKKLLKKRPSTGNKTPPPLPDKTNAAALFQSSRFKEMTERSGQPVERTLSDRNTSQSVKYDQPRKTNVENLLGSECEKNMETHAMPPPVAPKPKKSTTLPTKTAFEEFHEELKEIRKKILSPGLTLHTKIHPDRKSGLQTISTDAFFVELIEEEDESSQEKCGDSSDDDLDSHSLKSHHSYLDMNNLAYLKKNKSADRMSKSSDEDSNSDDETNKDGDYEKMKKLCEYRNKGPPTVGSGNLPKRLGKVIKSNAASSHVDPAVKQQRRKSRVFQTLEPFKYEISRDDYISLLDNIRGTEAKRKVIWNMRTSRKEYNYLTSFADEEDRSSDLGAMTPDSDKPHYISVYFDEDCRTDSIGGCSDLARMSYISALDGIYRTSTSYSASDGSVHYAYVYQGKDEDMRRVSRDLVCSRNLHSKELPSPSEDINSSCLTLDSGLSFGADQYQDNILPSTRTSQKVVQINISELNSAPAEEANYDGRHSIIESSFNTRLSNREKQMPGPGSTTGTQASLQFYLSDNKSATSGNRTNTSLSKPEQIIYANLTELRRK